ncbi:MAG: PEGA domain-containing protein [Deltaproteobacteria bacterium]|nr:PEGA domain-containing protein [Deltaproteobacteria bacterium]
MRSTRIAMFLAFGLTMAASGPAVAQGGNKVKAKKLFDKGVAALESHDYKGALESFQGAYQASPHWMVLAHIGNCYGKLNEPVEAIKAYEKYLADGGADIGAEEQEEAKKKIEDQRKKLGVLRLLVKPNGTEAKIDGNSMGQAPFEEILLKAGPHHILIIRGEEEEEADITINAGEKKTARFYPGEDGGAPEPAPEVQPAPVPEPAPALVPQPPPPPAQPAEGVLSVSANVREAVVRVDGTLSGMAPLAKPLMPGPHAVDVGANGYTPYSANVNIETGMVSAMDVKLIGKNQKADPLSVPFFVAVGIAGAGVAGAGLGWGLYAYYSNSEDNYAAELANPPFDGYSWDKTCKSIKSTDSEKEAKVYYCDTEWARQGYEDKAGTAKIVGIAGTAVAVVGGVGAALLYFKPEWFGLGEESDATLTLTPVATAEESTLFLSGTF